VASVIAMENHRILMGTRSRHGETNFTALWNHLKRQNGDVFSILLGPLYATQRMARPIRAKVAPWGRSTTHKLALPLPFGSLIAWFSVSKKLGYIPESLGRLNVFLWSSFPFPVHVSRG
jgi:hypothetical protein